MKPLYNLFMILALLIVLGLSPSQAAWAQTTQDETPPPPELMVSSETLGIKPVILYADSNVSDFQQGPPAEYQMMMAEQSASLSTSPFVIDYVPAGSYSSAYEWTACENFPTQAKEAFNFAAGIWASMLKVPSTVPIHIEACWLPMGDPSYLGFSWYPTIHANFSNAPVANTWYPPSLANSLAGKDLNNENDNIPEIVIGINSDRASQYYYGSSETPSHLHNLASIMLHEITHGLGFAGSMFVYTGIGSWGYEGSPFPEAYDRFAVDEKGRQLINTAVYPNNSPHLAYALQRNQVYFNGPNAKAANNGKPAKLFTPFTWAPGSSYAHLDDIYNYTPNALMTWSISLGETNYNPGPITKGLLMDLGWNFQKPTNTTLTFASPAYSEDVPVNTLIGTFTSTDPTPDDVFTYTLVPGEGSTHNSMFKISGSTLYTAGKLDHDKTQGKLSIRVRTTDKSGLYLDKVFTVMTKNVNEAATKVFLRPDWVRPSLTKDSQVTQLACDDPDAGDTFTYTFVEGENDNELFTISGNMLITNFDMPNAPGVDTSYTIELNVKDAQGLGPATPTKLTFSIKQPVFLPYAGKK